MQEKDLTIRKICFDRRLSIRLFIFLSNKCVQKYIHECEKAYLNQ